MPWLEILLLPFLGITGFLSWGLVEYGIHGVLSHRFQTPVSPLHFRHHTHPRDVFTAPLAWVPVALVVYGLASLILGIHGAGAFTLGLLLGFGRYERMHWRFHFRLPRNDREELLRTHHLAHHFADPRHYHGVTTRLWDRVFGTLPDHCLEEYARFQNWPVLDGASNLREIWNPVVAWERIRESRRAGGG